METPTNRERIKFFGPGDLANSLFADAAVNLIMASSSSTVALSSLNDALELHNALEFQAHGLVPDSLALKQRTSLEISAKSCHGQIARYFLSLNATNFAEQFVDLDHSYTQDLIELLGRHTVAKTVGKQALFDSLVEAGVPLWVMLADKSFVRTHERRLRDRLLSDVRFAELLIQARLLDNRGTKYSMPKSLTVEDSQRILESYIASESPHLNYVDAIAKAQDNIGFGITPKVRLAAQRRVEELAQAMFEDAASVIGGTSYAVKVGRDQKEPLQDYVQVDDGRRIYQRILGEEYLKSSLAFEQILANFSTIIGYMCGRGVLALPSFPSEVGVLEGLRIIGKDSYRRGAVYRETDSLTYLGTQAYSNFLKHEGIEVEEVIAWYFREYIVDVFGVGGFAFAPSTAASSFLERCRHLCAELEGIGKQFALYCDEGEVDPDLLQMTSAPRPWAKIPSLVARKYVVQSTDEDCGLALYLLFSDQSPLIYISDELQARSFFDLVQSNHVRYEVLHRHQQVPVDWLASAGLVSVDGGILRFASAEKIGVLMDIYRLEASPYAHYDRERQAADELIEAEWLTPTSTLLSPPEASYFNFFLNRSEFTDGHDLRNRYLHGTNPPHHDEAAHATAYLQVLRLAVALVLKIQDEFALRAQ